MSIFSSYHLIVLALSSLVHISKCQLDVLMPKIDLDKKSYIIDITVSNGHAGSSYEIEEMHSAWQERSKIHFEIYGKAKPQDSKDSNLNTFYADRMVVLKINPRDPPSCLEVSHDYVDQTFMQTSILVGFKSSYLIGAARLLSFVDQNRDKFSMVNSTGDKTKSASDYKLMFGAKFTTKTGDKFTLTLCYHEVPTKNLANGIPRRVIIETKSDSTIYQFTRYQPLKDGAFQASASSVDSLEQSGISKPGEIALDMFALNPNFGCSHASEEGTNLMELESSDSYRFSFIARSQTHRTGELADITVAYEPTLANLRVDQVQPNRAIIKIIDFWLSTQYHIVRKLSSMPDQFLDRVLRPDEDYSCVVSQVQDNIYHDTKKNQFSLGQMLLGTDRLVYLGLARVRGIEARVYESHDCNLPIWLQERALYEQVDAETGETMKRVRDEVKLMKEQGHSRTNVVYFAKGNSNEHQIWENKLLLVEVFIQNDRIERMFKLSFPIYDFSWDLPSSSPAGGRYEDSFSLKDDCVAAGDQAEYATINLLLEAKVSYSSHAWLKDRANRNVALLQMAQSTLRLHPIAMVYDIESRLTIGTEKSVPGSDHRNRLLSLGVSMRTAQRIRTPIRLVYMGQEKFNLNYMDTIEVENFQSCYMLAAHQKVDTIFGYRIYTNECFLIKPKVLSRYGGDFELLMKDARTPIKSSVEIYQVWHENLPHMELSRLSASDYVLKRRYDAHLYDSSRFDASGSEKVPGLKVDIKSYDINRLNEKLTQDTPDEQLSSGTHMFRGFGLVASDGKNKLVEIKQSDDPQAKIQFGKVMSFEHCQTVCLADFECRSFSVCIERGEMRCVLSKVSFAAPLVATQLMQLMKRKAKKSGEKFQVKVDPSEQNHLNTNSKEDSLMETIQLMSHRSCELHNKHYLGLFKSQGMIESRAKLVIRPVASLDQCAELCFRRTLESFREQLDQLANLKTRPSMESLLGHDPCHAFYFLSRERVDQFDTAQKRNFMKQVVDSNHQEQVSGYCTWNGDTNFVPYEAGQIEIQFRHYLLNFLTLYTKHPGVSMAESPLTRDEREDLESLSGEEIPSFIKPNENYGSEFHSNPDYGDHREDCAEQCTMHPARTAYPACRSFDVFEIVDHNNSLRRICAYNSMSLESAIAAKREDLIRNGSEKQLRLNLTSSERVRVWHYEPRHGLVAQYLNQTYEIKLAENIRMAAAKRGLIHVGSFGLFCCLVVAMSLGITAGLTLGSRYFAGRQPEHSDRNELIEGSKAAPQSTRMEFNNLVNIDEANGEVDLGGQ